MSETKDTGWLSLLPSKLTMANGCNCLKILGIKLVVKLGKVKDPGAAT